MLFGMIDKIIAKIRELIAVTDEALAKLKELQEAIKE